MFTLTLAHISAKYKYKFIGLYFITLGFDYILLLFILAIFNVGLIGI